MKLVVASMNRDKLGELSELLASPRVELVSLCDVAGATAPEESGATLLDNARIKARAAVALTGLPAVADDTGLEVEFLDGAPGVLSARFAGPGASSERNTVHLLERLAGVPPGQRRARFRTVCVARFPDGHELVAEGVLDGWIAERPRGSHGFGYDPVFELSDRSRTLAELTAAEKRALSHRSRAIQALKIALGAESESAHPKVSASSWFARVSRAVDALRRAPKATPERVSQRSAAERVLDHYRTLLVDLGAVVWEFDPQRNRVTAVSDSCSTVLGYTPQQLRDSPSLWRDAQHPDDRERTAELREGIAPGTGHYTYEHRMISPEGNIVWLHTAVRAARDADGRVMLRGVSMDITAHKRAGAELQGALSLLQATLDATDNGILVVGLDGCIASYNQKFIEIWGLSADVMGTLQDDVAKAEAAPKLKDPEGFLNRVQEIYSDRESVSFDVVEFQDGRVLERTSQPQRLGGATVGRVWSFRDVSERVRAERALRLSNEQLQQAQKMEAVGQLAGGVAHDFNNILTAVLGNLSLILADPEVPPRVRQRAEEIQLASERAANLTRQLLAFSRRQILIPRTEYLCVVLLEMRRLLMLSAGERIRIELDLMPEPCPVFIERGQMEQVILNLVINARDAMPNGGRIDIATHRVNFDPAHPHEFTEDSNGRHVVLRVSDNGEGMDLATLARVFEPFFTTKDRGRGTGLGLATAYGIVQQSGGAIHVRSAPGCGATFFIVLPLAVDSTGATDSSAPSRSRGIETVIVVEDEPPLRGLMRDTLARAGYRVVEVPNGTDALELCDVLPGAIEVLVTDVMMAGLDGVALATQLRERRAGLRILFVTGLAADERSAGLPPGASVLLKPFTMDALLRRVRELLDAG